MLRKSLAVLISFVVITISVNFALADCPSADLTGDCFVDFEDLAVLANQWSIEYGWEDLALMSNQWLTTDSCVADDMVYIPDGEFDMGDHHGDDQGNELPIHPVLIDSFFMSRYMITNQQYCDYLNFAEDGGEIKIDGGIVYAWSDDSNSYPYCDTHSYDADSQIDYNDVGGTFSVRTKGESPRDMSDDPMVEVSWYGAAAYCNWRSGQEGYQRLYDLSDPNWPCDFSKHGYRLATEAEWEYAARGGEHSPYYRFPWGDTISHSHANYFADPCSYSYDVNPTEGFHPDWDDGINPRTSVVGSFSGNGYGLYDMSGNVYEWCNDWYNKNYYSVSPYDNPQGPVSGTWRVHRGGGWDTGATYCRLAYRGINNPGDRNGNNGFRMVLDLN